jgi:DNA replication protein DnaC
MPDTGHYAVGLTGTGKTHLAIAITANVVRAGARGRYFNTVDLVNQLEDEARRGRHARLLKSLARIDLLILDDWGLQVLTQAQRIDLLEILEDRNGRGSTLITSQVPIDQWCDVIADPTLADAILDRFVHNAHRLNLTGDSMRRAKAKRGLDGAQNP